MNSKNTILDFTGQPLYIGLDVHKRTWTGTFCTNHTILQTVTFKIPLVENLVLYLEKLFPNAEYYCAYEAGFSGFWAQEQLEAKGIKTIVVNAADIPTSDKDRKFKNDPRDSRKIALSLRGGELEPIYIPSKEAQKVRSIVRERSSIANSQRRVKNQIKSHLNFFGINIPEDLTNRYWSKRFVDWLSEIAEQENDDALRFKIERHNLLRQFQLSVTRKLRMLSKENKYKDLYKLLLSVPGVGLLTNMLLITEIIDMKRFKTVDHLFVYTGFIPTSFTSGDNIRIGEMTNRGNRKLRSALIESSWVAIRRDPELLLKYETYRKRMGGNKAIVRIAKILLRRIRRVWLKNEPYQIATT